MKNYVMFGHNHLFGDYVDIIQANGDRLQKVVQNIPETPHPDRKSLRERLALSNLDSVEIQSLEDFVPKAGESYIFGFPGVKLIPLRQQLLSRFNLPFDALIHPQSIISPTAKLAEGVIIHAGVIIASGTFIGEHVTINKGAIIGHDTILEDYAIVQPGVRIAGHVRVGYGAYIGIGSTINSLLSLWQNPYDF